MLGSIWAALTRHSNQGPTDISTSHTSEELKVVTEHYQQQQKIQGHSGPLELDGFLALCGQPIPNSARQLFLAIYAVVGQGSMP